MTLVTRYFFTAILRFTAKNFIIRKKIINFVSEILAGNYLDCLSIHNRTQTLYILEYSDESYLQAYINDNLGSST